MWSDRADEAYKRLTRTIDVPAGGTTLSFWTSYNLELAFDYMIVEAHTVGQDNWTTLPDENGHTSSDLTDDQSCTGGWSNPDDAANVLHPFLQHYQKFDPATATCSQHRDDRGVERGERQLQRLAAVRDQHPGGAGPAGRDLDHCAQRLGLPAVPGRVHRRHRRLDRRGRHVVRGRRRPDGRLDRPRRAAGRRGDRGTEPQRLGPPWRPRDQGGRGRGDRRHALSGLRPRGHHGRSRTATTVMGRAIDYLLR